jgi:hypothetical protein
MTAHTELPFGMRHPHCEACVMDAGDRMLLWCEGGPSIGRATVYPSPLEIEVDGGTYVLLDDRPIEQWHYQFVREG